QRFLRPLRETRIHSCRIRNHGHLHLGQILYTGKDFFFIDFEGEPSRPLSERRLKWTPLRDVASLIRSFDFAAHVAVSGRSTGAVPILESAASFWSTWVSAVFLNGYLRTAPTPLIPQNPAEQRILLDVYLLERALNDLTFALNSRPEWSRVALIGLGRLLAA